MSSSFLPFLGQKTAAGLPLPPPATTPPIVPPAMTGELYPDGIPVTAPPQPAPTPETPLNVEAPAVDLASLLPKNASAEDLQRAMALGNAPERKGMFGIKGTLRDVLGLVGDAFLVQSGNNPIYRTTREKERVSDALIGMGPGKERDAIARAMDINPDLGVQLYKDWQSRMGDEARLDVQRDKLTSDAASDRLAAIEKGSRLFGQFAGALSQNPKLAPRLIPILEKIKTEYNLGDEFAIPGEADADLAEAYRYGGTPAQQQLTSEYRDRSLEQKESQFTRAEAGRMARDNPPAPRAPEGISAVDASVARAVLSGAATPAQQKYYNDRLAGKKGRRGSGVSPPPPKKGTTSRFRIID